MTTTLPGVPAYVLNQREVREVSQLSVTNFESKAGATFREDSSQVKARHKQTSARQTA